MGKMRAATPCPSITDQYATTSCQPGIEGFVMAKIFEVASCYTIAVTHSQSINQGVPE